MRPTAVRQSALRAPLNSLLGSEANVRLLRLLTETHEPVSGTRLARAARLSAPGAYRALEELRAAGMVERLGTGPQGQFRLRKRHPLAAALVALFDAERRRVDRLLHDLRVAAAQLTPPPRAVWLVGPVADETDGPSDPLTIAVIAASSQVAELADALRVALTALEARHDVTIEVRGLSEADLAALPESQRTALANALVLLSLPPDAFFREARPARRLKRAAGQGHRRHDQYLLHAARTIATKVRNDPTLVDRALRYIERRARAASVGERKELLEWKRILRTMSRPRLCEFLADPGPRATRLRQTLPFLDVLSRQERDALLRGGGK